MIFWHMCDSVLMWLPCERQAIRLQNITTRLHNFMSSFEGPLQSGQEAVYPPTDDPVV